MTIYSALYGLYGIYLQILLNLLSLSGASTPSTSPRAPRTGRLSEAHELRVPSYLHERVRGLVGLVSEHDTPVRGQLLGVVVDGGLLQLQLLLELGHRGAAVAQHVLANTLGSRAQHGAAL